jgi:hypothetical protein
MDLTTLAKIIFKDKKNYRYLTDKDKKDLFFIFNRYMARAVPVNSDAMNINGIDGALAIDAWNKYCERAMGIPDWFYPRVKAPKTTKADDMDDMDKLILNQFFSEEVNADMERQKEEAKKKEQIVVKKMKRKKKGK